jgi:hypothetical protein
MRFSYRDSSKEANEERTPEAVEAYDARLSHRSGIIHRPQATESAA